VAISSDQVHLPKITENSVPVYQSFSPFSNILIHFNRLMLIAPAMILGVAAMPFLAATSFAVVYGILFHVRF
jgi:hypothetical protein